MFDGNTGYVGISSKSCAGARSAYALQSCLFSGIILRGTLSIAAVLNVFYTVIPSIISNIKLYLAENNFGVSSRKKFGLSQKNKNCHFVENHRVAGGGGRLNNGGFLTGGKLKDQNTHDKYVRSVCPALESQTIYDEHPNSIRYTSRQYSIYNEFYNRFYSKAYNTFFNRFYNKFHNRFYNRAYYKLEFLRDTISLNWINKTISNKCYYVI